MWIIESETRLVYFISDNFAYRYNIVISAFNHTLIEDEISTKKVQFMTLFSDNVVKFLQQVNEHGSIIIMENANNVPITTLKSTVGKFFELIDNINNCIPFMIIFALTNNRFQKPYTHIFDKIKALYAAKNSTIILDKSIVIGNNAGRIATSIFKADKGDCDRAFASNIGIKNFLTPNQVFHNDMSPRKWRWHNSFITDALERQKILTEPSLDDVVASDKAVFLFIAGPPASTKTFLGNRFKSILGAETQIFDINHYKDTVELVIELDRKLHENIKNKIIPNIIVIDLLETSNKRQLYFDAITKFKLSLVYNIKYLEIDTDINTCEFLNKFNLQLTKKNMSLHHKYLFNNYFRRYSELSNTHKTLPIKYIKFPLILREHQEIFYHF